MHLHLTVKKADQSTEDYLHTKVIGTINNALCAVGETDVDVAEHLAEAVTFYLYETGQREIASMQVLCIIKAVLTATGYESAAAALSEHHYQRKLNRSRIEVVSIDVREPCDIELLCRAAETADRQIWDKSMVVDDLVENYDLDQRVARTIASMVEDKVFRMGVSVIPVSLIRQLIWGEMAAVLRADRQLRQQKPVGV